ncbi:hypothetical protein [Marinobacterium lutimaris]|uniref:DUF2946 domain-containing protein n=1 Tax=Marinobacterium lutimaris TaxID=568106 RepID=A0A1H5X4W9_9GAMM|nr:hypothetical protein [Marinobacterium lutimaris]SEG06808.1 hypothetical protein SAMN05444390_1011265 [Marinobacterium lutimaris]
MRRSAVWLLLSLLLALSLMLQPALNAFAQFDHLGLAGKDSSMQISCSAGDHGCHMQAMDQQMSDCCDQASAGDCSDHCSASGFAMLSATHARIDAPALQPLQARGSPASPFVTPPEQPPRFA